MATARQTSWIVGGPRKRPGDTLNWRLLDGLQSGGRKRSGVAAAWLQGAAARRPKRL